MSDSVRQNNLELEVRDFGPIIAGEIDLRPLTVFVGPSNTGKTYLATLIYALHKHFSKNVYVDRFRLFETRILPRPQEIPKLDPKSKGVLTDWIAQLFLHKPPEVGTLKLPDDVSEVVHARLGIDGVELRNEILRCFGVTDPGALRRKARCEGAHVILGRCLSDGARAFRHEQTLRSQYPEYITHGGDAPLWINIDRDAKERLRRIAHSLSANDQSEDDRDFAVNELLLVLVNLVLPNLIAPLDNRAFYLPASRTGLIENYDKLITGLLGQASVAGIRSDTRAPTLSGVVADFLAQLIDCDSKAHRTPDSIQNRATKIEEHILGGSVSVEKSEGMNHPVFSYRPAGWKKEDMRLMNASSMVTELTPIVLFLRQLVRRHNLLIIDEPEAHLHPALQVEFTRQLAAIVNLGVRVVLTTHSEWVLETLANIVRRSTLPKAEHNGDVALRQEEVGAWLFRPKRRPKGSVVEEIKLDHETGLYPTDYGAVSEALYNENVSIFNQIQDANTK